MAKSEVIEVHLNSAPMLNTPGLLAWAMNGYKFKKDRKRLRRVFVEGFNLSDEAAHGLLSGKVPYRVEGGDVIFSYAKDRYKKD